MNDRDERTMRGTKNQHFNPRLHLRYWADADECLWTFDKTTGRSWTNTVENTGAENHFFTVPELDGDAGPGTFFEDLFNAVEGPAGTAIRALTSASRLGIRFPLLDHRGDLATFLAFQYVRTPEARERVLQLVRVLGREYVKWIAEANGFDPEGLELVPDAPDELVHAGYSFPAVEEIAETLHGYVWLISESDGTASFFSSDHPLAIHAHHRDPHRGVGIGSYGVEVQYPLSPRHMLLMVEPKWLAENAPELVARDGWMWRGASADNVLHARWLQFKHSRRFVYTMRDESELLNQWREEHPEYCRMDRPRFEVG